MLIMCLQCFFVAMWSIAGCFAFFCGDYCVFWIKRIPKNNSCRGPSCAKPPARVASDVRILANSMTWFEDMFAHGNGAGKQMLLDCLFKKKNSLLWKDLNVTGKTCWPCGFGHEGSRKRHFLGRILFRIRSNSHCHIKLQNTLQLTYITTKKHCKFTAKTFTSLSTKEPSSFKNLSASLHLLQSHLHETSALCPYA